MIVSFKHFENGVLVKETSGNTEIFSNIGKTPLQISSSISTCLPSSQSKVARVVRPHKPIEEIPYHNWPLWAKTLVLLAKPEDKGIGDVVLRTIGETNSYKFKAWHKLTFGKDCNCAARQARWNAQYPLSK